MILLTIMSKEKRFKTSIIILAIGLLIESICLFIDGMIHGPKFNAILSEGPFVIDLYFHMGALSFFSSILNIFLVIFAMIFAFQMRNENSSHEMKQFIKYFIIGSSLIIILPFLKTSSFDLLFWCTGPEGCFEKWYIINNSIGIGLLVLYFLGYYFLYKAWKSYTLIYPNDGKIQKRGKFLRISSTIALVLLPFSIISSSFIMYEVITVTEINNLLYLIFAIPGTFALATIQLLFAIGYLFIGFVTHSRD